MYEVMILKTRIPPDPASIAGARDAQLPRRPKEYHSPGIPQDKLAALVCWAA